MTRTIYTFLAISAAWLGATTTARATDLEGSVIVNRKLTRPRVTATVPVYQRGAFVALGAAQDAKPAAEDDPLATERTRVIIYIEGPGPAAPVTATIEQRNREFVPDTVVIPDGSEVSFPNHDPIFHNIFSLSKGQSFDLGNYLEGQTRVVAFHHPGVVYVNCHLHPNMSAAIVVTPNGWYARADRSGRFTIPRVPSGHYTVVAWHKSAGFFRQTVDVTEQGNSHLEFLIPLPAEPSPLEARN